MKYVRPYKRWEKAAIWLFGSQTGQLIWGLPLALLIFSPIYWLGWWWIAVLLVGMFAFTFGWNAAVRRLKKDGFINKI